MGSLPRSPVQILLFCIFLSHGQEVTLDERAYRLVVPVQEPYLRLWRKEEPDARARGGSV